MLEEIREESGITPQALLNRPTLDQIWVYPLKVWRELSADRSYISGGMGAVPSTIPFSVIMLYCSTAGMTRAEAWDIWQELSTIDSIWLSINSKKRKAQADQNKTPR